MEAESFIFLRKDDDAMKLVLAWGHLNERGLRVPGPPAHSLRAWAELAGVHAGVAARKAETLFAIEAIYEDGTVDETAVAMIRGMLARQLNLPRRPKQPATGGQGSS